MTEDLFDRLICDVGGHMLENGLSKLDMEKPCFRTYKLGEIVYCPKEEYYSCTYSVEENDER